MVIFLTQSVITDRDTKYSITATPEPNKKKAAIQEDLLLLIQFWVTGSALEPSVSHPTDPSIYQWDHKFYSYSYSL